MYGQLIRSADATADAPAADATAADAASADAAAADANADVSWPQYRPACVFHWQTTPKGGLYHTA